MHFLIIEDEDLNLLSLVSMLRDQGRVTTAKTQAEALKKIEEDTYDLAFVDLDLDVKLAGLGLLKELKKKKTYSVVISSRVEDEHIIDAYRNGCKDFLSKPFYKNELELVLKKYEVTHNHKFLEDFFKNKYVTQDKKVIESLSKIEQIVISNAPVLLTGETGTGKTLVAELIHEITCAEDSPFIHLNCAETPENLIESELFGYEKGAFSGAENKKKGKMELASGGTLFLDEIGTMPLVTQQKLLKAIESKSFYPLGGTTEIKSNFKLISATCDDLAELIKEKKFREDFYQRIDGHQIKMIPLRDRRYDIPLLIKHFQQGLKRRVVISDEVKKTLQDYQWPGNIRELRKLIEMFSTKPDGIITAQDISFLNPEKIIEEEFSLDFLFKHAELHGLGQTVEMIENEILKKFLEKNEGKVRKVMSDLKLATGSFYRIHDRIKDKIKNEEE